MSEKFKEGDIVYFYTAPGLLEQREIQSIENNGVSLSGYHSRVHISELFHSAEEAAKTYSPTTLRMRACLIQSKRICDDIFPENSKMEDDETQDMIGALSTMTDRKAHILSIAFKLFDAGCD